MKWAGKFIVVPLGLGLGLKGVPTWVTLNNSLNIERMTSCIASFKRKFNKLSIDPIFAVQII